MEPETARDEIERLYSDYIAANTKLEAHLAKHRDHETEASETEFARLADAAWSIMAEIIRTPATTLRAVALKARAARNMEDEHEWITPDRAYELARDGGYPLDDRLAILTLCADLERLESR